eukprot:TRINITY_DN7245_c0_g1_i1.p2 TRINITY_DN7245_c0_g1~~TRINITY_DN7245_c0_g1_i1.p2  ORF type:complete len:133 (+),score=16.05 TRINITY_DN7245_c0_g1_i1:18-416(+)
MDKHIGAHFGLCQGRKTARKNGFNQCVISNVELFKVFTTSKKRLKNIGVGRDGHFDAHESRSKTRDYSAKTFQLNARFQCCIDLKAFQLHRCDSLNDSIQLTNLFTFSAAAAAKAKRLESRNDSSPTFIIIG